MQKLSVLVASKAVLNAPQKMIPATKPASTSAPRLNTELGRRSTLQISRAKATARRHSDGCETSAVVISALQARLALVACRYPRSHYQPAAACYAAARDIRCRNNAGG